MLRGVSWRSFSKMIRSRRPTRFWNSSSQKSFCKSLSRFFWLTPFSPFEFATVTDEDRSAGFSVKLRWNGAFGIWNLARGLSFESSKGGRYGCKRHQCTVGFGNTANRRYRAAVYRDASRALRPQRLMASGRGPGRSGRAKSSIRHALGRRVSLPRNNSAQIAGDCRIRQKPQVS